MACDHRHTIKERRKLNSQVSLFTEERMFELLQSTLLKYYDAENIRQHIHIEEAVENNEDGLDVASTTYINDLQPNKKPGMVHILYDDQAAAVNRLSKVIPSYSTHTY